MTPDVLQGVAGLGACANTARGWCGGSLAVFCGGVRWELRWAGPVTFQLAPAAGTEGHTCRGAHFRRIHESK